MRSDVHVAAMGDHGSSMKPRKRKLTRVFQIRFSAAEINGLERKAHAVGVSVAAYVRDMNRRDDLRLAEVREAIASDARVARSEQTASTPPRKRVRELSAAERRS
jgi:hypothetical protein